MRNTHGGVLLSVKLQAKVFIFTFEHVFIYLDVSLEITDTWSHWFLGNETMKTNRAIGNNDLVMGFAIPGWPVTIQVVSFVW